MAWAAALILPHFQAEPMGVELFLGSILVVFLWCSINNVLRFPVLSTRRVNLSAGGFFLLFFLGSYALLKFDRPIFYDTWSRFGAGSMEREGVTYPFGDLVHLTEAARCTSGVVLASNSCDPWGRLFNQNPDIPAVLSFLRVTNVEILGVFTAVVFVFVLFTSIYVSKSSSFSFAIFLFSPVVVLAVERGNEILTIIFILIALRFLRSEGLIASVVYSLAMFTASFFKLWPLLLVILFALLSEPSTRIRSWIALLLTGGYWALKADEIRMMLSATQDGYPYGVAFGWKLFLSPGVGLVESIFLFVFCVAIFFYWVMKNHDSLIAAIQDSKLDREMRLLVSFLLCYAGIWFISDSFIYRMLILLPVLLLLSQDFYRAYKWAASLTVLILVVSISSKLAITPAVSSALALVSVYISTVYFVEKIKRFGTLRLRKSPTELHS